jgi:hypothetical protein
MERWCEGSAPIICQPKWFTKNPDTTPRQDVAQMLVVIEHAAKAAVVLGGVDGGVPLVAGALYAAGDVGAG